MFFKISTYNEKKHCDTNFQFYIQSKGRNAGRPLQNPKPNCWTVETDIQLAYEICTVLWIAKKYDVHIIGSVIPFLRMKEYLKVTIPYLTQSDFFEKSINETLSALGNYEKLIDNSLSKLRLLKSLKTVTAYGLLKKIDQYATI